MGWHPIFSKFSLLMPSVTRIGTKSNVTLTRIYHFKESMDFIHGDQPNVLTLSNWWDIYMLVWTFGPYQVIKTYPAWPYTPLHPHVCRSVFLSTADPFKLISFKLDVLLAWNHYDYYLWQWISGVLSLPDSVPLAVWDQANKSDGLAVLLFNGSDKAKYCMHLTHVCAMSYTLLLLFWCFKLK